MEKVTANGRFTYRLFSGISSGMCRKKYREMGEKQGVPPLMFNGGTPMRYSRQT